MEWTQIVVVTLTVLAGLVTWWLNERSKRWVEDYTRRETRYAGLVTSIRAFQMGSDDRKAKEAFLHELDLCWLYGSDEVIRAAYALLGSMKDDVVSTPQERNRLAGMLALAIRHDLLSRSPLRATTLTPDEFELLLVK